MRTNELETPASPASPAQSPRLREPVVQVPESPSQPEPFPDTEPAVMPYVPTTLDISL